MDPLTIALATFGIQKLRGKSTKRSLRDAAIAGGIGQFAGMAGVPGIQAFGSTSLPGMSGSFVGQPGATVPQQMATSAGGIGNLFKTGYQKFQGLDTGAKLGIGGALVSALAASGMGEEEIEAAKRDPDKLRIYLKDYFSKLNPNASDEEVEQFVETNVSEYATGGRVGFKEGMNMKMASMDENEREFMRLVEEFMERGFNQQEAIEAAREEFDRKAIATGGRVGFAGGTDLKLARDLAAQDNKDYDLLSSSQKNMYNKKASQFIKTMPMAQGGMPTGIMRTNQAGTIERDYRETGGFVPVGIKEKADDVPAMLSKNEFVMTADAVRGMGDGSIEKGAQKLYDQMKRLENKVV